MQEGSIGNQKVNSGIYNELITQIGNANYWDNEEEKLINGQLELVGCGYNFAYDNFITKTQLTDSKEVYISAEPLKYSPNQISVNIAGEFFIVSNSQLTKIKDHFGYINEDIEERKAKFKDEVMELKSEYYLNSQIREIMFAFLKKSPYDVFLDLNKIFALEYLISCSGQYRMGHLTLLSNEGLIDEVIKNFKENNSFYLMMENFKSEHFDMLIRVLSKKYSFTSEIHCIFTTMSLLRVFAQEYYANLWQEEYGNYFIGLDMNKDEYLKRYCSIETLKQNNIANAMKFTYYIIQKGILGDLSKADFIGAYEYNCNFILKEEENKKVSTFERELTSSKTEKEIDIDDVDLMSGQEFEVFISLIFSKMGYCTKVTKASGDQGIDVIAEKNGKKIGIQAKCYSRQVSNSAIQEVVAGIKYYNLDKAIVVTNNYFSKSAQELAQSNNVVLWDRSILKEKINEIFSTLNLGRTPDNDC